MTWIVDKPVRKYSFSENIHLEENENLLAYFTVQLYQMLFQMKLQSKLICYPIQ